MLTCTWLIEPQYGSMDWLIDGLLPVKRTTGDKWGFVDRQHTLRDPYEISQYTTNVKNYLQVGRKRIWTFMDMQGQLGRALSIRLD